MQRIGGIALLLLIFSCVYTNAPQQWLMDPRDAPVEVRGSWIEIHTEAGNTMSGELIAFHEDSVFVADTVFHAIALPDVTDALLVKYRALPGSVAGLTILGVITTIGNGFFLVFTAPLWIIVGSAAARSWSKAPLLSYPEAPGERFAQFARFPQGLPQHVDRAKLKQAGPPGISQAHRRKLPGQGDSGDRSAGAGPSEPR